MATTTKIQRVSFVANGAPLQVTDGQSDIDTDIRIDLAQDGTQLRA